MCKTRLKLFSFILATFFVFAFTGCDVKNSNSNSNSNSNGSDSITEYSISYELAGGILEENAIEKYVESDTDVDLPTATKTGYTFLGWREGTADPVNKIPAGTTGDKLFTAVWQANQYTITFKYFGGTDSETTRQVLYDEVLAALPTPTVVPTGKIFAGWKTEDGASFSTGAIYKFNKNITVIADYSLQCYSIEYNLNGGNQWGSEVTTSYSMSEQDIDLPTPTRNGYKFLGWKEGTADPVNKIPAGTTGDKIFTAVWEGKIYSVTFDNTSVCSLMEWDDDTEGVKEVNVRYGEVISVPNMKYDTADSNVKNNDDHKFKYWYYKDANNKKIPVDLSKPFTEENFDISGDGLTFYVSVSRLWTDFY